MNFKQGLSGVFLAIIFLAISNRPIYAQTIIFTESFDEVTGSTNGSSAEGVNWNATCPDCAAGDSYEVSPTGGFRGNDTNGPATWCTDPISIPAGTEYIVLEMDFDATEGGGYMGSGNLETSDECGTCPGTVTASTAFGCSNCWDFVFFEVDEGGGNITSDILLGQPGTADEGAICQAIEVTGSTEFKLSLIMSMWASSEFLSFDNVTVTAYNPAEAVTAGIASEGACPICELELGTVTVSCNDALFEGANTDVVEISIPFSGAGTGSEVITITASGAAATNTGDDPNTMTSGTITFAAVEGDAYSVTLDNSICSTAEMVIGTVDMDLCPAACMIEIQQVTAVCSNDGTTNYDLCIDFTHSNPDANALVDIEVNDGSVIASTNNVATTGNIQQQKYTSFATGDATANVDINISESGGGVSSGMFTIDFDGNNTGYVLSSPQSGSSADYWGVFNDSGISASFTGSDMSYFAAQDDSAAPDPSTITIANIDISCLTSPISFSVDLAEDDDGTSEDWDNSDFVHIDYSIDGGAIQNLLWIENDGSTFNTAPLLDTDFNGDGDGTEITDTWSTFSANITGTGNLLTIVITIDLDSGDEDIAIDNIQIGNCSAGAACDNATTFTEPDCSCPAEPTVNTDGPYTVCDGTSVLFTDATIGGSATTGTWAIVSGPSTNTSQLSDANPVADPSTVSFTPDGGLGVYVLSLTADNPFATCTMASQNVTITVEEQETATLEYTDDAECNNGTDLIPTVGGTTGGTFTGSLGLMIDTNTGVIDVSGTTSGAYMVTYTSSSNTCRATATDIITINASPDVTPITAPTITCPTQSFDVTTLTLTDNNSVVGTTTTYHTAAPTSATDNTNEITGAALTIMADATIFVMVANTTTGCFDVESVLIDIPDSCCNITDAGVASIMCNNAGTLSTDTDDTYTFTLSPTGTGLGTSYTVSGLGTPTGGNGNGSYNYADNPTTFGTFLISGGDQTITVTDDATGTCQIIAPVAAPATCSSCPVIEATIAGGGSICSNNPTAQDVIFTITGGSGTYDIVYNDGTTDITLSSQTVDVSNQVIAALTPSATTDYILVSVTDTGAGVSNACVATTTGASTITVNVVNCSSFPWPGND